jgi:hypothetical protein
MAGRARWASTAASKLGAQDLARSSGCETLFMVATSADSHAVSSVLERHCCVCWIIAWFRLKAVRTNLLAKNPFRLPGKKLGQM